MDQIEVLNNKANRENIIKTELFWTEWEAGVWGNDCQEPTVFPQHPSVQWVLNGFPVNVSALLLSHMHHCFKLTFNFCFKVDDLPRYLFLFSRKLGENILKIAFLN